MRNLGVFCSHLRLLSSYISTLLISQGARSARVSAPDFFLVPLLPFHFPGLPASLSMSLDSSVQRLFFAPSVSIWHIWDVHLANTATKSRLQNSVNLVSDRSGLLIPGFFAFPMDEK